MKKFLSCLLVLALVGMFAVACTDNDEFIPPENDPTEDTDKDTDKETEKKTENGDTPGSDTDPKAPTSGESDDEKDWTEKFY